MGFPSFGEHVGCHFCPRCETPKPHRIGITYAECIGCGRENYSRVDSRFYTADSIVPSAPQSNQSGSIAEGIGALLGVAIGAGAAYLAHKARDPVNYPNVIRTKEGTYKPASGYKWVSPNSNSNFRVVWNPGQGHPKFSNVIASESEGEWIPDEGYKWFDGIESLTSIFYSREKRKVPTSTTKIPLDRPQIER